MTTDSPPSSDTPPTVDYSTYLDNGDEALKVASALGTGFGSPSSSSSLALGSSFDRVRRLAEVIHTDVKCDECGRTFVDEASLRKHMSMLHVGRHLSKALKNNRREYSCEICHKTFGYAVNVRKHKWLVHRRVPRPVVVVDDERALDRAAAKLKRAQERFEDMTCSLCGMEATSWKQLNIHMMDHSKERPFKCEECGKGDYEIYKRENFS